MNVKWNELIMNTISIDKELPPLKGLADFEKQKGNQEVNKPAAAKYPETAKQEKKDINAGRDTGILTKKILIALVIIVFVVVIYYVIIRLKK